MLQILYDNEATVEETEAPDEIRDVTLGADNFNVEVKEPKIKKMRPSGLSYNKKRLSGENGDFNIMKSEFQNTTSFEKQTGNIISGTPVKSGFSGASRASTTEDEFAVFGRYIGNELRQVHDSFAQQTAKMKINTILFEALTGQYNRPQAQIPEVSQPYQIVVGSICPTTTTSV